jgi:hypothetical protein
MLKIWLTWLQPSLGILGIVLVLTSPLYSVAAQPNPVSRASKATQLKSVVAGNNNVPTGIELTGIAATPDLAVRQLANDALKPTKAPVVSPVAAKDRQQSNRDALDSFLTPPTPTVAATKATKPKSIKRPVTNTALARTAPKTTVPVAGLFIGNTEVRGASKYSPDTSPASKPIASAEIGAPTPLSAMMAAPKTVSPYPVVSPEMMQKLGKNPAVAKTPISQPLSPIATVPSGAKKAQTAVKAIATVPTTANATTQSLTPTTTKVDRVVPQSLDPIAKIPAAFHQEVPNSLDPIASIPAGLQRLLGNNLKDTRPVAPVRVAKAIAAPKANLVKDNALLALTNPIAPTTAPEAAPSSSSLKLATAQAYVSVPKFDIPGERLSTVTLAKPTKAYGSAKRLQKATLVAKVPAKNDYLSLVTARQFEPHTKQAWTLIGQRNTLGGLILGSQPQATPVNKIVLLPTTELTTSGSGKLSGIERLPLN